PLSEVHEGRAAGPHLPGARLDQWLVVVLLAEVRAPAPDASRRDDRCEEIHRDGERVEERSGIEIDIGNEAFCATDALVELHRDLIPLELARLAARLLGHAAQDRRARIAGLVHAMAEAHEA